VRDGFRAWIAQRGLTAKTQSVQWSQGNREADAATRGAPFTELTSRGLSSRDWLEAAREEKELPFLFLEAGSV
jgi:hypothetical protein